MSCWVFFRRCSLCRGLADTAMHLSRPLSLPQAQRDPGPAAFCGQVMASDGGWIVETLELPGVPSDGVLAVDARLMAGNLVLRTIVDRLDNGGAGPRSIGLSRLVGLCVPALQQCEEVLAALHLSDGM